MKTVIPSRSFLLVISLMISVVMALAMSTPAFAQGNGKGKNKNERGSSSRSSGPNQSTLPAPTNIAGPAGTAPFAWMDDASLMTPGMMWLGMSMVRWQGAGASETNIPVIDAAIGLSRRVQFGASVPRVVGSDSTGVDGGLGTSYFSAKIGLHQNDARGLKLAVAPTLGILSQAALQSAPDGQGRTQWGLPVSIELVRRAGRIYSSAGYFSPGVWYAGAGAARPLGDRVGMSISFSRAWTTSSSTDPAIDRPDRNEVSGGLAVDLKPHLGLFGSIGRTIGTAAEDGAGTTFSIGLSLTGGPVAFTK